MKKHLITAAFFLCLCFTGTASTFRLIRGVDALGKTSLVLNTGDVITINPDADGNYTYDTGDKEVAYILINGTACYPDVITQIQLQDGVTGEVSCSKTDAGLVYTVKD